VDAVDGFPAINNRWNTYRDVAGNGTSDAENDPIPSLDRGVGMLATELEVIEMTDYRYRKTDRL